MLESTHGRIHSELNQLMVAATHGCKVKDSQSQKSRKVKPSGAVGFAHVPANGPRQPMAVHAQSSRIGAGELGLASWKLGRRAGKLQAGSTRCKLEAASCEQD